WNPYLGFDVAEYKIERSVNGSTFKTIGTNPIGKYEFIDNLVSCGDSIAYRVSAINAKNKAIIAYSDIESTLGTDTIPPATNSLVNITTANTGKDFVVSWNPSTDPDIESYSIIGKPKNATTWTTYGTGLKGTSFTVSNLNPTEGQIFEFKVTPQDSCGNIQRNYSPAHQSLGLVAKGHKGYVNLEWNNYRGWKPEEFKIFRNGILINTMSAGQSNADSIYTFKDTISACDTATFSYYIEAINGVGLSSISNVDTALAIDQSAPVKVYLKNATTLDDGTIEVKWREYKGVEEIQYRIEYSANGDNWTTLTELLKNNSLYAFTNPVPGKRLCLRISTFDDCGNVSKPSNLACVILLEGGNLAQANSLKWTKYETWIDSVGQYTIYRTLDSLTWYPIIKVENRVKSYVDTILVNDIYTYCYKVEANSLNVDNPTKSSSNVLCIKQEPILYIPNTFTPDASAGINDAFGPIGSFLPKDYSMKIYSRWGQRIYETNNGEEWNGSMPNGDMVPAGLYLYVISFTNEDGEVQLYEGAVRVLK
ncbi:MAG: gliding motility-associated C-terminal domain-containing protein, partial [Bacteroidetes bacterium]|nr:gliding motility-associated C-terminal domain-containing protein [Bacteroidota bacterium]